MEPNKPNKPVQGGFFRFLGPFIVVTALMIAFLWMTNITSGVHDGISISQFEELLEAGSIKTFHREGTEVICELKETKRTKDNKEYKKFRIYMTDDEYSNIYVNKLKEAKKNNKISDYDNTPPSKLPDILVNVGIFAFLFLIIWFLFFRKLGSGPGGIGLFGKSKAQLIGKGQIKVTFNDVAGIDEAKEEVQEIIQFLKSPQKIQKMGGRIPHGVLLIGPPGTGKTLLAKAIAGEAEVPFFSISGSDFVELFVGVGASRVRDLFAQARSNAPCIIFLDEIDAVGRKRGPAQSGGGTEEREQTLNAILVEMQGLTSTESVIVISATNRPDMLDPALLRPGRFDRRVYVDLPDVTGREAILDIHVNKNSIRISENVDLSLIARSTPTFSGAELENLLNEAALIAVRSEKENVEMEDLEEARDKVRWGRELKSRTVPQIDKRRTAFHEAGHALITALITELDPLHKVSIIPRGRAMGATMMLPKNDEFMLSKTKIVAIITSLLAGRIAEDIFLGNVSTGAQNDIERTTELARRMVCEWGMSDKLGPVNFSSHEVVPGFEGLGKTNSYSEDTARLIDEEIFKIIDECSKRCRSILEDHINILTAIADALIEKETLSSEEVGEIVKTEADAANIAISSINVYSRPTKHSAEKTDEETFQIEDNIVISSADSSD